MSLTRLAAIAAILGASATTVRAADYSVEELRALFERQKQAFTAAEQDPMGQTRGLKLVTVEDVDAEPADGATVTTDAGNAASSDAAVTPVAGDPDAPLVFGQLDPELQVNLHITFGFDSAALAPTERPKLATLCTVLQTTDLKQIRVVGHTDSSGSAEYNERLSILRAKEVARFLVDDCGIAPERLQTIGMGERFPFNRGDPRADENRRVEFQALS